MIPKTSCTRCKKPCLVQATESSWLADPRCSDCGGPWPVTETFMPDSVGEFGTGDQLTSELAGTLLDDIGVRAGASLSAALRDGRSGLLQMDGSILGCVDRAVPADTAATER